MREGRSTILRTCSWSQDKRTRRNERCGVPSVLPCTISPGLLITATVPGSVASRDRDIYGSLVLERSLWARDWPPLIRSLSACRWGQMWHSSHRPQDLLLRFEPIVIHFKPHNIKLACLFDLHIPHLQIRAPYRPKDWMLQGWCLGLCYCPLSLVPGCRTLAMVRVRPAVLSRRPCGLIFSLHMFPVL